MINNKILVTPRIKEEISNIHYLFLCELIEEMEDMEVQKNYLQVFTLRGSTEDGLQEIEHTQRGDKSYKKIYKFYTTNTVNTTIYVALEENYSVMMFGDEY